MYNRCTSLADRRSCGGQDALETVAWFCLRTAPKHERLAVKSLQGQLNVETFSPQLRFKKATRRGPVWFVEAMFPSYIFARFEYRDLHRQVQYAAGVSTIVRFGNRPISISDSTIDGLRSVVGQEEVLVFDPELQVGDTAQITAGAFQGLEAVVTQLLPAKERVRVLVDFLGRQIEAEIEAGKLLPAETARQATLPAFR